jgi:hypothetical protein
VRAFGGFVRGILLYVRDFLLSVPYFLFSVRTFQALSVRAFWGLGRGVFVFCALLFIFCALISGTFCARFWWVCALDLMSCALLFIFCALFGTPLFTGGAIEGDIIGYGTY